MREKIRVLYAEERQGDRALNKAHFALEAPEFEIDIVGSREELLNRLRHHSYDLLVLSQGMADLEGLEVLGQVQPTGSFSPVLFVASAEGQDLLLQVLSVGQSDYVSRNDEHFTRSLALLRRLVSEHRRGKPRQSCC